MVPVITPTYRASGTDICDSPNYKDHAVVNSRCGFFFFFIRSWLSNHTDVTLSDSLMTFSLGWRISFRNAPLKIGYLYFFFVFFRCKNFLIFQGRCENLAKGREKIAWLQQVICSGGSCPFLEWKEKIDILGGTDNRYITRDREGHENRQFPNSS